ncbi:tyrosine-protein phosphatase [Vagococcus fluvialis]|uniref:tyrosine-protein phosphatase n=1 Tax=Vagococcus fluvialis TaxID=2738 RepID=UPI001A8DBACB|nr:tyrosine-protein phosphatase [Vagococcus fluvialis]MBO0437723.1 tyrosine-protein phosphatase [Vagococcus fluvialis]
MNSIEESLVPLEGTFNTRDLGGYHTMDGKVIKKGRLFRSDDLHLLSSKDIALLEEMAITTIVDYRNDSEREKRPNKQISNTETVILAPDDPIAALASADIKSDQSKIDKLLKQDAEGSLDLSTNHLLTSMLNYVRQKQAQTVYSDLLHLLIKQPNMATIQHCRGGKDRTGYGTALILLALGVKEETVIEDYLLTNHFNRERNEKRMNEYRHYTTNENVLAFLASAMATKRIVIEETINEMKHLSGSPLNYIKDYLHMSEDELNLLRKYYLEDI